MDRFPEICPGDHELAALVHGDLGDDDVAAVAEHVDGCARCEARVEELERSASDVVAILRRSAVDDGQGSGAPNAFGGLVLQAGAVLDDYVIDGPLGAGGMGQVYRATHRRMRRTVAIKVMSRGTLRSPELIERFHREVEAVARLSHPHVALAYDAGEWQGEHYLVMEYIAGRDLARVVREDGPLSVERAVNFVTQAARGLAYAHRHGLIHRDVKPANLMLAGNGTIKVLDLGLARSSDAADVAVPSTGDDHENEAPGESTARFAMTQAGTILGTSHTMAPEQALGAHRADARSDIYSLGCALFFLVAGRYPFERATVHDTLAAHREQAIPTLADHAAGVTPRLERVFQRMLAKRPDDRWASMDDVAAELERCPVASPRPRRTLLAAGLAGLVAAALGTTWFMNGWPFTAHVPPAPAMLTAPFKTADAQSYQQAWADHLQRPPERTNPLGMKLLLIPPGQFALRPSYHVTISRPLEISACEVTVGQFRAFVAATGHVTDAELRGGLADTTPPRSTDYCWKSPGFAGEQTDAHPVLQISWRDATMFCRWLSDQESARYRLPTEAEWEWAARAGGPTVLPREPYTTAADYGWLASNSGGRSHPVGTLRPNAWGLCDMAGNAAEWCQDIFQGTFPTGSAVDPQGANDGLFRTLVGTAFHSPEVTAFGPSVRGNATEPASHWGFGFRVVCEPPASRAGGGGKR